MSVGIWALCAAIMFGAAIIRGMSGFGLALAAAPALSLFLDPIVVVPTIMALQVISGSEAAIRLRHLIMWRPIIWLTLGALVGMVPGFYLLSTLPANIVRLAMVLIVGLGVLALAAGFRLARPPGAVGTAGVGLVAGVFNGLSAMAGPPAIALFLASPLEPRQVRASLVTFFMATGLCGLLGALAAGVVGWEIGPVVLVLLVPMFAGNLIGEWYMRRSGFRHYRTVCLILVAIADLVAAIALISDW